MPTSTDSAALGRVRWKRFAAILVPGVVGAGALLAGTANGAISPSFAVSGSSFKVSVDSLDGQGFEQFGGLDKSKDGKGHPIQVSAIRKATIRNMCQSMVVPVPGIGKLSVILHAGGPGGAPVKADNLVMDVESLQANAKFTNIQIGRDASTVNQAPAKGQPGMFAQQADAIHLDHVKQVAWATTAGTFRLNGLKLGLKTGSHECF